MKSHIRARIYQNPIAACRHQYRYNRLHILLVQVLLPPPEVHHPLFMGAKSVQRFAFLPFEFQLCMKSLPVEPPVHSFRSGTQPIRPLFTLYRVC
ncbi:hypothetical protein D3C81_2124840 [compost metagenome]